MPSEDIDLLVKNTQLFFVKIFGCLVKKGSIPIDLDSFSESLLTGKSHKSIYMFMCRVNDEHGSVGYSDVKATEFNGKVILSCFYYMVGKIAIGIVYDPMKIEKRVLRKCLHPRSHGYKLSYRVNNS